MFLFSGPKGDCNSEAKRMTSLHILKEMSHLVALDDSLKNLDTVILAETTTIGQKLSQEIKAELERTAIFSLEQEETALKQYQAVLTIIKDINPPVRPPSL